MTVRPTAPTDLAALREVLDSIELFPSEMLTDLSADFFHNPATESYWLTALQAQTPVGLVYCEPETLTDGTFNMRAIGVHAAHQGKGIGKELVGHLEIILRQAGHRLLIVDTSGTDSFAATRRFYTALDYEHAATIRDFWAAGDDKVIFRKAL